MYPLVAPAAQYITLTSSFFYLLYEISVPIPKDAGATDCKDIVKCSKKQDYFLERTFLQFLSVFSYFQLTVSVTRFGDFLDFVQLFNALGNNLLAQISYILRQIL